MRNMVRVRDVRLGIHTTTCLQIPRHKCAFVSEPLQHPFLGKIDTDVKPNAEPLHYMTNHITFARFPLPTTTTTRFDYNKIIGMLKERNLIARRLSVCHVNHQFRRGSSRVKRKDLRIGSPRTLTGSEFTRKFPTASSQHMQNGN